jgi:ssRNA-specific RNase YbeY (16S rRNA maturation enzyme)
MVCCICAGFDDIAPNDARRMNSTQQRILAAASAT